MAIRDSGKRSKKISNMIMENPTQLTDSFGYFDLTKTTVQELKNYLLKNIENDSTLKKNDSFHGLIEA